MMYTGSEAYRLDDLERGSGAGLDARVRRGVSASFLARIRIVAVVAVILAVIGIARVGVFAAAVSVLSENATMRSDLKEARSTEDELKIERSVLSSSSRIDRIATQNYGMVRADSTEQMSAGSAAAAASDSSASDEGSDQAASDQATSGDSSSDASDQSASSDQASSDQPAAASDASGQAQTSGDKIDEGALTQGDGSTAGANAVDVDSLL